MKGKKYILSRWMWLVGGFIFMMPGMLRAQTFRHYEGIANQKGDYEIIDASQNRMRQKTHECHYYVPIKQGGTAELALPLTNYSTTSGAQLEPRGYYRWYNYDTDLASSRLSLVASDNTWMKSMTDEYGVDRGLVIYNMSVSPCYKNMGVKYTRPSDANWQGENVACDVSRYADGCKGEFLHEPTLSIRYVFHMIPSEKFADSMMDAVVKGTQSAANDLTYEDNKEMSVGLKDVNSTFNLRINFNTIGRYFFHPMSGIPTHHVYYNNEAYKILESYFDKNTVTQPNAIMWRVYSSDKSMCHTIWNNNSQFLTLSFSALNSTGWEWWTISNQRVTNTALRPKFDYGSRVYVVAYAYNTSNSNIGCPIANFAITLYQSYPKTQAELQASGDNTRMVSYLEDHYRNVALVSFDDDDEGMTMERPTSPTDNQALLPSRWSKRSYGFVYENLKDYIPAGHTLPKLHSPLHGEYGLYKSANVSGKSSNNDQYLWWASTPLYDRTYEMTNGAQYGHFLYVDAADESRQIAEADFKANLCAGSQVIFSSAIAEMTTGTEKAQLLFKLYGVHYDENNQETDRKLLQSFSTGDFKNNVNSLTTGKWYQGYGKMVLQKESGVGNYEDFKIVIDNLCKSTAGADYAFDDLRIYTQASKVDVIQSDPICPDVDISQGYNPDKMGKIKLKVRALQETMAALADHQEKKLYFRFVDSNTGKPTTDINYAATSGEPNYLWGSTTIHSEVDNGEQIDGAGMYEKLNDEWYVILANRNFNLDPNKKYYISFAFDDETVTDKNNLSWGKPSDVCSLYSSDFNLAQQTVVVTDANGTIATAVTIPCDDKDTPEYDIKAQLQTVDQNNGGTINLQSIKFNWYVDNIHGDPVLRNSTEFKGIQLSEGEHTIYVEPVNTTTKVTEGGVEYEICLGMMSFKLRAVKNGPKLGFGFSDVVYPDSYERTVRLGLPQIKELAKQGEGKGYFQIPVRDKNFIVDGSQNLLFVEAANQTTPVPTATVYLSDTNDPIYANQPNMTSLKLGELQSTTLARDAKTLNMKFMPQQDSQVSTDGTVQFHEGYWYEGALIFNEDGKDNTKVLCSGEAFVRFEIVPEYVTWYPTAKGRMSAAWNNDQNWVRSTRQEIYKTSDEYVNYVGGIASDLLGSTNELDIPRQNSYVPMKFTKVTIPNLSGLYFPDLGYIAYRQSNQIATKLSNAKGDEATANIQYAILAKWDANAANHGLTDEGNLGCEKFYGNTCDQIYFKPGGELLDQCFLLYNKAWVEKEMRPNTWYALTLPLKNVYAGDIYVPKANGRQETEAFKDITFSDAENSRVNYPFYQRSWDKSDVQEVTADGSHGAYDYAGTDIDFDSQNLKTVTSHWSHVYNKVDKAYDTFEGLALKVGDAYAPVSQTEKALVRLPKADVQYQYEDAVNGSSQLFTNVDRSENGRLAVDLNATEGALSNMSLTLPALSQDNAYYLVGNPYMATLSMYYFLRANSALSPTVYVYEDGALKTYSLDTSVAYDVRNDVKISPMQAFFVKLRDGEQASALNFTASMTIDREVFGTSDTQQSEDVPVTLSLTAFQGNVSSSAMVKVYGDASEDYDGQEDAPLLYDENLKEVPTLYTVAGDQAVAINQVPEIRWMPLGVIASSSSSKVTLTAQGAHLLDAPLYLYDAKTQAYQEVEEGMPITIQANDHGRYFLTQTRGTTGIKQVETVEESVKVYAPTKGLIVVSSTAENELQQVEVFTVDGKQVADEHVMNQMSIQLPVASSAVYIVKVKVLGSEKTIIRKLSVR